MKQRGDRHRDPLEGRPINRLLEVVTEILMCPTESKFGRSIGLENAVQRRLIARLVSRGRAQSFVDRGIPVCAEGLRDQAAEPLAPKTIFEKPLDRSVIT